MIFPRGQLLGSGEPEPDHLRYESGKENGWHQGQELLAWPGVDFVDNDFGQKRTKWTIQPENDEDFTQLAPATG